LHLFIDISSHGLGHLAISAPVINALARCRPRLRLTIRSGLTRERLAARIDPPFEHIAEASDFGYRMIDATHIDLDASALAYRATHADWAARVGREAGLLLERSPDLVLSNVSYLPLAGAAAAGLPCAALCSLNWADLFRHYFGRHDWAPPIHRQMLDAYRAAEIFLRPAPSMPMPELANTVTVAPIARLGTRHELRLPAGVRAVLIAMGGFTHRLPIERWPRATGVRWLVPTDWHSRHPDAIPWDRIGLGFTDLLASVDAVITKPGYGTFTEAACNGVPVLHVRREDWPEQACLIEWIQANGRCLEIDEQQLATGELADALAALGRLPPRPIPRPDGAEQAAERLLGIAAVRRRMGR
jgi:hypothetical protein